MSWYICVCFRKISYFQLERKQNSVKETNPLRGKLSGRDDACPINLAFSCEHLQSSHQGIYLDCSETIELDYHPENDCHKALPYYWDTHFSIVTGEKKAPREPGCSVSRLWKQPTRPAQVEVTFLLMLKVLRSLFFRTELSMFISALFHFIFFYVLQPKWIYSILSQKKSRHLHAQGRILKKILKLTVSVACSLI